MVRRNRKHLFVLDHQNEEPRSSSVSLGFGESTLYNLINPVRRAFKFKSPVDSSTELDYATDYATCSASHSHISDSKDISSSNPEGVMEMGRSRARLRVRFSRGSQTTLRQRSLGWKRRRLHLLSWKTRLIEKNQLR